MDNTVSSFNVFPAIDYICKQDEKASKELTSYLAKQVGLNEISRNSMMSEMTDHRHMQQSKCQNPALNRCLYFSGW